MALFGNDKNTQNATGATAAQNAESQNMGDQDYFEGMAGAGQEQFSADMLSTPYLSMAQPRGKAVKEQGMQPATWYNSASGENFGPTVKAVMLAVKTAWIERDTTNKTWMTVARYEPNSIEVVKTMPKPGQRGFPEMKNPQSGNKIEELFIYAVMLPEHPEAGVLYFSPTAMSMSACKAWNTKVRNQRLPSGKLAPIFAFSWELSLELTEKNGNENARLMSAIRADIVSLDLFKSYVQPQLNASQNLLAIAAPEADEGSTAE